MKRLYKEIMDEQERSDSEDDEDEDEKPSKKLKKDPNRPKKPRSAYMFFSSAKRAGIKEAHPDDKPTEIMKKIAALWKSSTDEDKAIFNKEAEEDKIRYAKEMENYEPPSDVEEPSSKKRKKYGGPKKPKTSYVFFTSSVREKIKADNPDIAPKDILKKCGEMWRELSDEEKKPFEQQAAKAKAEYLIVKEKYDREHPEDNGGRKKKKKTGPKKPKTAYICFTMAYRPKILEEFPGLKQPEILSKLGAKWKTLNAEEKMPYEVMANKDKERFIAEMEAGVADGTIKDANSKAKYSTSSSKKAKKNKSHAAMDIDMGRASRSSRADDKTFRSAFTDDVVKGEDGEYEF